MAPEPLAVVATEQERAAAERVHPAVLAALSEHYTPDEVGRILSRGLSPVHLERRARFYVRQEVRRGRTKEQAIPDVAETVHRSVSWVDKLIYPRGTRRAHATEVRTGARRDASS